MNDSELPVFENVSCPLGCDKGDEVMFTGCDLLNGLPGEFTVVKCAECGLMRTNPRPTPQAIQFYYPDSYSPYHGSVVKANRLAGPAREILRKIFGNIFSFNTTILPKIEQGRMLEIGCASGNFMHRMATKGWEVQGVEFSEKVAKVVRELGYEVHAGSLESAPHIDKPFDLIVGWMVLEHLHDPVGCLEKLRSWAKPGAWLVLSVPNAGSLEFQLFKEKWYALQLPTHLYHFTPETIKNVLSAGGWRIDKIHHQRILSNVISSMGYSLKSRGFVHMGDVLISFPERAGHLHYLLYPLAWILSLFGQTGRMTIWARVK